MPVKRRSGHRGVLTAVAIPSVAMFPGIPEADGQVRTYLRQILGPYGVDLDDVVVVASELFTNAINHSRSRNGGLVGVTVAEADDVVRVEVIDEGCDGEGGPVMREDFDAGGEGGRGLQVVASYAKRWGWERRGRGGAVLTVVWFEMAKGV